MLASAVGRVLTEQPFDARLLRLSACISRHASSEGRQLLVGFGDDALQRVVIGGGTSGLNQASIEFPKPMQ